MLDCNVQPSVRLGNANKEESMEQDQKKDDLDKLVEGISLWWKRWRMVIISGLALLFIVSTLTECNRTPGTGQKVGQIVKVSKEGFLFKTYEAQLIRGGLTDGSGTVGTVPFDFTIRDKNLVKKAEQYMESQMEVIIVYKVSYLYLITNSENHGIYLLDIQPVRK